MLTFEFPNHLFKCIFVPEVLEEWPTQTSYDMGLETEREALEKLETRSVHQEQVTTIAFKVPITDM